MKKLLVMLITSCFVYTALAQDYDLIVKTNGDSIACHINSIVDSNYYFTIEKT